MELLSAPLGNLRRKRRWGLIPFVCCLSFSVSGQLTHLDSLRALAKSYRQQGDFPNAIIVLNHLAEEDAGNLEVIKDLAFTYYLQRNYSKALETAKPLLDRKDADVECFQIVGMVYKAIEERKECEKMYKQGIKKFPESGVLYNEYGEMLFAGEDNGAIKLWEKGIEVDPNYSSNYYNAAKFYNLTSEHVWNLIYGEIFVNLESYSRRTPEIKNLLADGYKKLFSDASFKKGQSSRNPFIQDILTGFSKESDAIARGIDVGSLTALRSRFIVNWFANYQGKYPFRLFVYHQQLLKAGMFDAYNQWIFGAAQNLQAFQTWTTEHTDEYNKFISFQRGRVFKLPQGQFYHDLTTK